ncbi:undecaprenyl-diphosphate phosphatase [Nakamurella endophytica]|uniref:Undecaprenyl-diphosphatase n=1 Tax=Nakamurella endophytica TaxID=1748367 RepID=A0A917SRY7_9ACTN|nr:undecaprenyl-diphosphate phosphatase [Nakamurella endophytica]GGL93202.1 undecaprenyl-diphosphatase 1 [Nakamurella endophytica]
MTLLAAVLLGIVEGLTEFLPVSSTGHLTIVARLLGYDISSPSVTGFTAVIQVGAIIAVIIYFRADIVRLLRAWFRGLFRAAHRSDPDYRMAWLVIVGSLPIVVAGYLGRHLVTGPLRSLWVVAVALIVWGVVMLVAEALARQDRAERELTWTDTLLIGVAQCLALVPGVSRSGATISVGLLRGLDRVAATRLSFLLGIPALVGAGVFELPDAVKGGVGALPTLVGTVVSFVVAYASVAWLLRFVARHKITVFVWYRWLVGALLIVLLSTGVLKDVA